MIKSISKDGLYNMGRERSFSGATRERSVSGATTVSDTPSGMRHVRSDISLASLTERIQVPLLGFGTFNDYENHSIIASAVKNAIKCGYRHFNLAKMFDNESEIGAAIRESIAEGVVDREELFISSKLWCDDQAPEDVETALRGTLKRTGLDYVDNFMVHWPTQWLKGSGEAIDGVDIGKNVTTVHVADEEVHTLPFDDILQNDIAIYYKPNNLNHDFRIGVVCDMEVNGGSLEKRLNAQSWGKSFLLYSYLNAVF